MTLRNISTVFWCFLIAAAITSCRTGHLDNHNNSSIVVFDTSNLDSCANQDLFSLITTNSNKQNELVFEIGREAFQDEYSKNLNQVPDSIVSEILSEMGIANQYFSYKLFYYSYLPLDIKNGVFLFEGVYNDQGKLLILVLLDNNDRIISKKIIASFIYYPGAHEKSGSHIRSDTVFSYSISGWATEHPIKEGLWYSVFDSITTQSQIMQDGSIVPISYYDSVRIDNPY